MAELNNNASPKTETYSDPIISQRDDTQTNNDDSITSKIDGLTQEEYNDPNKIAVTMADQSAPIVVLFGPPACGKTMTMVRLTRYLRSNYTISPVRDFRPADDGHYQQMCDKFRGRIAGSEAAAGNDNISFMLIDVLRNAGQRVCQILEAPGECYHHPKFPDKDFFRFVYSIISSPNRKIWVIMVEPNWKFDYGLYVEKIKKLRARMRPADKVIFLYNKIDATDFVRSPGNINTAMAIKDIENHYRGVFEPFKNLNPITRLFKKYNCHFVPFSTGNYHEASDGSVMYTEGDDVYPAALWNTIMKCIRG